MSALVLGKVKPLTVSLMWLLSVPISFPVCGLGQIKYCQEHYLHSPASKTKVEGNEYP